MHSFSIAAASFLLLFAVCSSQYAGVDPGNANLYADYAGGGGGARRGRPGPGQPAFALPPAGADAVNDFESAADYLPLLNPGPHPFALRNMVFAGFSGFALSKLHSRRSYSQLSKKHNKEIKAIYSQYRSDMSALTDEVADLTYQVEYYKGVAAQVAAASELDALQRDYSEFKQPDVDGDEMISRGEFNHYVANYLAGYPGLAAGDYPRFEDFDHDKDGFVSFDEYSKQMAKQVQEAEWEAKYGVAKGGGGNAAANYNSKQQAAKGIKGLYGEALEAENFKELYGRTR